MAYRVAWKAGALKQLSRLPAAIAGPLAKKVETYLAQNPQRLGKALLGDLSGLYRYRYGAYRIIYEILEREVVIQIVAIGHRKDVYG